MKTLQIILIGAYHRTSRPASMEYYLRMLERELLAKGCRVEVLSPQARLGLLPTRSRLVSKLMAACDKLVIFPIELRRAVRRLRKSGPVVVHIIDPGYAMYTRHLHNAASLVTVHDLMTLQAVRGEFPERQESRGTGFYQEMMVGGLRKAGLLVAVSQTTHDILVRLSGIPQDRIRVIYNAPHHPYAPMPQDAANECMGREFSARGLGNLPFFLHVGINTWYKNREGVLRIFAACLAKEPALPHSLVMIGPPLPPDLLALAEQLGIAGRLVSMSGLSHDSLKAAYSIAEALIFPSWHEGFGWPIIEAQYCGCPVFTSNRPPMTEVGGDGVAVFDPSDPDSAAAVVLDGLRDREALRGRGFANASRFKVSSMMDQYEIAYRDLTGQAEGS